MAAVLSDLRTRWRQWLFQFRGPESGVITLHQRRVFILPTRSGMMFAVVMLLLLLGSINYQLSLGFVLTFFVSATAVVGMHYTFRNLAYLKLSPIAAEPTFAGDVAEFLLRIENPRAHARFALAFSIAERDRGWFSWLRKPDKPDHPVVIADVDPKTSAVLAFPAHAQRRGWMRLPRLRIDTSYPFGLFNAWSYWQPDLQCLVYPAAEVNPPAPPAAMPVPGEGTGAGPGQDDFSGIREFRTGDPLKHVAWKVAARFDGALATKLFEGAGRLDLVLDWKQTPEALDVENRISRLTAWVLEVDAHGLEYALVLPRARIDKGRGPGHRDQCLKALALE